MKLQDVFTRANIVINLQATQKRDAIHELVERLAESGEIKKGQLAELERALMRREELGSTGIGKGVAVPHAKHAAIQGVLGAFGRSTAGIEFNSLDGNPVHLVFLLVSSPDAAEPHLAALRKITTLLKDDDLCAFLKRAKDEKELAALMVEADERLG